MDTKSAIIAGIAGVALGYFLAKKQLQKNFDEAVEKEIDATREYYKNLCMEQVEEAHKTPEFTEQEVQDVLNNRKAVAAEAASALVNYQGKSEDKNLEEAGTWDLPRRDIHIISLATFLDTEVGYDNYAFEYFAGDETLVGENDRVLTDKEIERTIGGRDMLTKFGEESENKDALFVRNPKAKMDIEITRTWMRYRDEPEPA